MVDVADQLAVHALLLRLARETDFGSIEDYLACFDEGAALEIDGRPSRVGHADIEAAALEGRGAGRVGPDSRRYHTVVPGEVRADGDGATCESRFLFVAASEQGTSLVSVGRYHDVLVRADGGWKLRARRIEFG